MKPFDPTGLTQDEIFKAHMPDNLYLDHYTLARFFPQHTPEEWRLYLQQNQRFILNEVAAITEANARQALSKLSEGTLTTQEVSAIRQLLERSEQINQSNQEQRTFVFTKFDMTPPPTPKTARQKLIEEQSQNLRNIHKFYGLDDWQTEKEFVYREEAQEFVRNAIGTLHFPNPRTTTALDKAYLRLYNPTNERTDILPDYTDETGDVQ